MIVRKCEPNIQTLRVSLVIVQREKEVLAANFEEKLLTIQNDHEEHMALILEEVKIPPSKTTTGTAMTPKANRENVKVPNDAEYYAYESFLRYREPKAFRNPSNVTKECIKQDISLRLKVIATEATDVHNCDQFCNITRPGPCKVCLQHHQPNIFQKYKCHP